jgi:hypothetical protein
MVKVRGKERGRDRCKGDRDKGRETAVRVAAEAVVGPQSRD